MGLLDDLRVDPPEIANGFIPLRPALIAQLSYRRTQALL
jgi:hypothetical protein